MKVFLINYHLLRTCGLSRRRAARFAFHMTRQNKLLTPKANTEVEYREHNGMAFAVVKVTCPATPECDLNNPCATCPAHGQY